MRKTFLLLTVLGTALCAVAQKKVEIRRNQVGMTPQQEKVIVVEGMNPKGKVRVTTPDGRVVKPREVRKAVSPLSGKTRYVVTLGDLGQEGRYQVSVGGSQCELTVAEHPYHDIATSALRLFYLIRSGVPIEMGGDYNRPLGHPDTKVLVHPSAASPLRPAGTVISSPLGWYDAGDYNKYVVNSSYSIGLMLCAYEQQQAYFRQLNVGIPESGNQTADLLDEMMYNLRWLLTMQDAWDGGVYHKLTTPSFEAFIMPADCRQQRYVVAKSTAATLDFAAVMAQAARLMEGNKDYPAFAEQARRAALAAYHWAEQNPQVLYRQDAMNEAYQPAVTTGAYGDSFLDDEWYWAATELYLLSGDGKFLRDAEQRQPKAFHAPSWASVAALGAYEWLTLKPETALVQTCRSQLLAYADSLLKAVEGSCFQSPSGNGKGDFGWGCLGGSFCSTGVALLFAHQLTGDERYLTAARENADYVFGRNALSYCFVTGFGTKSPQHPHHRISEADAIEKPFPGLLVGGPNPGQQDKKDVKTAYRSNLPDESYLDVVDSYASNEIAINWNAELVALVGWLDALD